MLQRGTHDTDPNTRKGIMATLTEKTIKASKAESRNYQIRLGDKVTGYFNEGIGSAIINSPTGSGKTVIGLAVARNLQIEYNIGIGWVAMRRTLLTQAAAMNRDLDLGVDGACFISMFDKTPPAEDAQGRPISLLVVDEAQHDAANSMSNIHNRIQPRWILGLTATPYRTDRVRLCFDKVVRDIGIHQLIQKGYLSPYHQYTIPEWTVDQVVKTYLREPERWGKSVMYWHKREDAIDCVSRLQRAGIRATTVFGDHPISMREERLEKFEAGEIDVLINMMLLTEGWDSPGLKTVFVRDSQKGPTIQMAGRVFRKYPGIEYKQVVQSKGTKYPIHREAHPAESLVWMKDSWRSYIRSPAIELVMKRALISLTRNTTELPDFIIKKKRPRRRQY